MIFFSIICSCILLSLVFISTLTVLGLATMRFYSGKTVECTNNLTYLRQLEERETSAHLRLLLVKNFDEKDSKNLQVEDVMNFGSESPLVPYNWDFCSDKQKDEAFELIKNVNDLWSENKEILSKIY